MDIAPSLHVRDSNSCHVFHNGNTSLLFTQLNEVKSTCQVRFLYVLKCSLTVSKTCCWKVQIMCLFRLELGIHVNKILWCNTVRKQCNEHILSKSIRLYQTSIQHRLPFVPKWFPAHYSTSQFSLLALPSLSVKKDALGRQ